MAYRIRASRMLLAGGLLLATTPAFAQEGMLFKNLVDGMGLFGRDKADIEYKQRAPLVVPPSSTLPKPQEAGANRSAAWPDDPDVARRKAERDSSNILFSTTEAYRANTRPLMSQEELRRGRVAGRANGPEGIVPDHNTGNNQIEPIRIGREMAARQAQTDTSNLAYGTEPARRFLHEPPTGYRRPAATAALGPGQTGPREDKQAVGQREFLVGQKVYENQ
ncbi:hypothetical protein SAMN04515666_102691 [Bosea lupini]|jgi:hypothetical protein|uniref:DUF4148 domain-containing protein n=1 Tax=Bosea lupini TaxID=1036779 RepID=A0A1H7M1A5_9HYPH|nr:hypothetical protein [Bosea lupini]SEL05050.1 hypothetical protein SAMN04515666_102691 [Bosea lupini]